MKNRKNTISETILAAAADSVRKWRESDITLDECVSDIRNDFPDCAKTIASVLFEYFRHKSAVDELILSCSKTGTVKPELMDIAVCTLSQCVFQSGIAPESAVNVAVDYTKTNIDAYAGSFVNAVLRAALRKWNGTPLPDALPEKLTRKWKKQYPGTDVEKWSMNRPGLTYRLRAGEPFGDDAPVPTEWETPFRFYSCSKPDALFSSALFQNGEIYIQDPATSMSVSLCVGDLHGKVLDACAAPGGKTIMLSDSAEPGTVIAAADKSSRRMVSMRDNFARMRLDIQTLRMDATVPVPEKYNLIFIDAPCTNTGVLRRRPDAAWRYSKRKLEDTVKLQRKILENLSANVLPGGVLLYSTCSIESEENGKLMEEFVTRHPDFTLEKQLQLLPAEFHDGAFAAKLRRKK